MNTTPLSMAGFAHPPTILDHFGLTEGMVVADFGAGSGHYSHLLADAVGKSGRVYAIDVQRDLLKRIKNDVARRGQRNIETIWGDLENTEGSKIADHSLDFVLMSN